MNDLEQYYISRWYLWLVVYGLCAIISVASAFIKLPVMFYISPAVATISAAAVRIWNVDWSYKVLFNPDNPSGNETGGLLLIGIWMAVLTFTRGREFEKKKD